MMTPDVPTNGPAFEAMMRAIDAKLADEGKRIDDRALLAVREVSLKYRISIPLGGGSRLPPDLAAYAPLGEAIHRWYQENYGERLKVDPCPGQAVVPIDADLYILRIPGYSAKSPLSQCVNFSTRRKSRAGRSHRISSSF